MSNCPIPADRWLRQAFADRSWLDASITAERDRREPIRVIAPNPTNFGLTFEVAVQFDQCRRLPRLRDLHMFPAQTAGEIARSLAFGPTAGAPDAPWFTWRRFREQPVDRAELHRAASCVAVYLSLIGKSRDLAVPDARQILGGLYLSDPHLRYAAAEAPAFCALISRYDRFIRSVIGGLGPVFAAPSLPGGRTADLVAGRTIIEIKTGWLEKPDDVRQLLDQLLGYGLLSLCTSRPATHVAAYLARYGALLRFPLRRLLNRCATHPIDLIEAAHHYRDLHLTGDERRHGTTSSRRRRR